MIQSYGGNDIIAGDLDQNGTIDLIGAGYKTSSLDWWSNDGFGNFGGKTEVKSGFTYSRNVDMADIDGDGDNDLIACADNINTISWFENDGSQAFNEHIVNDNFDYAYFVTASDLDGDGDVDLIGTAQNGSELSWWENNKAEWKYTSDIDPDTMNFNNNSLVIDYAGGFEGGETSVFFNNGYTPNIEIYSPEIDSIAKKGYYTITTNSLSYSADLQFSYGEYLEWNNVALNELYLRICYWDELESDDGAWIIAGDSIQQVDTLTNKIFVYGLKKELKKFSKFTVASASKISAVDPLRNLINNFPTKLHLEQNYPNPFNGVTKIKFTIPSNRDFLKVRTTLKIYDVNGRHVKTLKNSILNSGKYEAYWDGRNDTGMFVASGIYFAILNQGTQKDMKKLTYIK